MRIISGTFKGRRITAPKKLPVRPTTDMAKEGLFNILNNHFYFDEIAVLDLFAGTGNISYEFASRGASKVTAVDADHGCTQFIGKTSDELEMDISVIKSDVFSFLEKTSLTSDIIFADPPYNVSQEDYERIPYLVFTRDLLLEGGQLIVEHSKLMTFSHLPQFLNIRTYGSSAFSFFGRTEH